jgi:DNA repair protein RadA/Sms
MPKKPVDIWVCSDCGERQAKWSGQCPACHAWGTLKEFKGLSSKQAEKVRGANPIRMSEVKFEVKKRVSTGIDELDLVLGGGVVPGSVLLLGGRPGVGKSTLAWQAVCNLESEVVYIAGEESVEQIKMRSERLGQKAKNVTFFENQDILSWIDYLKLKKPALVVIDSIQTVYRSDLPSSPGSIVQVKESAIEIIRTAKSCSIACIMIGHVTKDGEVAGPRTLEHLVDGVFYLEGEEGGAERFLKSHKNRFGPTDELGVLMMTEKGMTGYTDFGKISQVKKLSPGVARLALLEGSRVYFIEVQSLVQKTNFGFPKRTAVNYDLNRLQMIIAVLGKHTAIDLSNFDVYLNVAEGYKLKNPISDLAVIMSLASSFYDRSLPGDHIFLGEVDLSASLHLPASSKKIIKSIQKLGLKSVYESKRKLNQIISDYFN